MDHLRQVRFIIGPFFFLASLSLGSVLGDSRLLDIFLNPAFDTPKLVAVAGIVGASILPLGFLIGATSSLLLAFCFVLLCKRPQASFSPATWKNIMSAIGNPTPKTFGNSIYAAGTFELGHLPVPIYQWIDRRWNAFNASINACVGLAVAYGLGQYWPPVNATPWWLYGSLAVGAILIVSAILSWRECMGMIAFQALPKLKREGSTKMDDRKGWRPAL